jgi:surface protein
MKKIMVYMLLAFVLGLLGCVDGDNLSSTKAITSFIFESPAATGEIDETDHTISIAVPSGTAVTALVPTILHTGESISPESGVAQDFTNPVTYTVTAEEGFTQDYLVTIAYKADQTAFSAGSDQNKLVTDTDFTQAATGVEGTGTTSYVSSDTDVATVDDAGLVQIVGVGVTEITAENSGDENYFPASDSYLLTVRHPEFITTWQTDDEITIPVLSTETYNYSIDWGDGDTDTGVTGETTHTYSTAGTYTVTITGDFPAIYFYDYPNEADKILTIEQWGGIKWKSMVGAFVDCENLEYNATDTPDLAEVTDMGGMFAGATAFDGDLSGWDVGNVTDMYRMFAFAVAFNGDISGWDVGNVTDTGEMFNNASSFNGDLSGWNVGNVTMMDYMFFDASSFNSDLSRWDVGNVTIMEGMFAFAEDFNGDISGWNVGNVIMMAGMFFDATSFNGDLSSWNVGNVTIMEAMFAFAEDFNGDISGWDVGNVIIMDGMFYNAASFSNHDLSGWDVSQVISHDDFSTNWGTGNTEPNWP